MSQPTTQDSHHGLRALVIGAIGVVYGDIGTSPLYTMKEAFGHAGGLHVNEPEVLGVLSLVFWSMTIIVTLKYVTLILRADNRGEGGVLAMTALAQRGAAGQPRVQGWVLALSIAGLALFYGDGLITPAISVLSAVEGLQTARPDLEPWVVPIATGILIGLFVIQRFGTGRVGALFGPIMVVWFAVLAILGLVQIVQHPGVLRAINPLYIPGLFELEHWQAFVALGAIVLAVTGAEALYADMGHFGREPIRLAWVRFVMPALLLNYFGQGAMIIADPATLAQPFFHLAPAWLLFPLIGLATLATVIASQAVISGVFSLTQQAMQLGYLPRMAIRHTSAITRGQIYIPRINWLLMLGVVALVWGFASSSNLAAAYGISVTAAMGIDAMLAGFVALTIWGWSRASAIAVFGLFLLIDLAYIGANALKIPHGGWFPLLIAAIFCLVVATWRQGRRVLQERLHGQALPVPSFIEKLGPSTPRVAGTAVYMTSDTSVIPTSFMHNLKHNKVVHERVLLLKVLTGDVPYVGRQDRISIERLGKGFFEVCVRYGFMDEPDVPQALEDCRARGLAVEPMATSFFLGRETLIPSTRPELGPVQERLFMALSATAQSATHYFRLPPDRVVELGAQVEI